MKIFNDRRRSGLSRVNYHAQLLQQLMQHPPETHTKRENIKYFIIFVAHFHIFRIPLKFFVQH